MAILIILAIIWVALTANFTAGNILFGLGLSLILLLLSGRAMEVRYFRRPNSNPLKRGLIFARFILFFLKELLMASVTVFAAVLRPDRISPAVVAVPLDLDTNGEVMLLANLITLTPGTLSLDVSTDRKVIYVHTMYMDDPDEFREEIKTGFEKRVMEVMRS